MPYIKNWTNKNMPTLDLSHILAAAERIKTHIHYTPVMQSHTLNELCGCDLFFKCENLQKVGAFKFRGAMNALLSLTEAEKKQGVATQSSGNHAAGVAYAAKLLGIPAYIVMPKNAPETKKQAVAYYGGQITFCEPTLAAREQSLAQITQQTGAIFIPPYNDERIIAGQGTAALELLQQTRHLDIVMAPVGGGGLLSGAAITVKGQNPNLKVIAAEPAQADDAYRSFYSGQLQLPKHSDTIADGLRTGLGDITFAVIRQHVDAIMLCSEAAIKQAMLLIWQRLKVVIEPSSAVPLAVILENKPFFTDKRIGIILTGGNLDLANFIT